MKQTLFFPRRLNDADAGFFFLGRRRDCNVAMIMLGVLEGEIPFDAMIEELTAAGEEVPRFKDFLSQAPLDLAPPVWLPKEGFSVSEQIREVSLPPAATWEDALALIDRFQGQDFPAGAPPWEILLVKGLPEERALLAMKVHHALSDGMALSLLFAQAFGGDFFAQSGMQVVAELEAPPSISPLRLALSDRAAAIRTWLRRGVKDLPALLNNAGTRRLELDAIKRHLRPRMRLSSAPYGTTRRLSGFRVPADIWNREAHRRGGSANDLYLAIVANAMRRYFVDWNLDEAPIQVVMPVNVRGATDVQHGGNLTGVGVVGLAGREEEIADLSEVRRRSREVQERVGNAKPSLVDGLIQLLPGGIRAPLQFREFATRDVVATNVPMPIPGELCGVAFKMMFMVAPAIGTPVSFSLTSYGDHFYLASNVDLNVVTAPLDDCLASILEEIFADSVQSLRDGTMTVDPSSVRV